MADEIKLKPKQRELAELMVNEPDLSNVEYAKRVGIDPKTLYKWQKTVEFQQYKHELCRRKFASLERLAMAKLQERVKKGDMRAITYVLDGAGYKASERVELTERSINITINE